MHTTRNTSYCISLLISNLIYNWSSFLSIIISIINIILWSHKRFFAKIGISCLILANFIFRNPNIRTTSRCAKIRLLTNQIKRLCVITGMTSIIEAKKMLKKRFTNSTSQDVEETWEMRKFKAIKMKKISILNRINNNLNNYRFNHK